MTDVSGKSLFRQMTEVAQEQGFGLARGYGDFLAYYPKNDMRVDGPERAVLAEAPDFDDEDPGGYKIHLNPADNQLALALSGIAGSSSRSSELRQALYEAKIWFGGTDEEFDNVPRVVLYPRSGSAENALIIAQLTLIELGRLGVSGSGREPVFNLPIVEGFAYVAQGDRSRKESDPAYKSTFAATENYAAHIGSSVEMRTLVQDINRKL